MDKVCANPFVMKNKISMKHKVMFVLMAPIALIRAMAIFTCAFCCWFSAVIISRLKRAVNPDNYVKKRKYYMFIPILLFRMTIFFMSFYWIKVIDRSKETHSRGRSQDDEQEKLPPIVLFVPHSSIFDFITVSTFHQFTLVVKREIAKVWFFSEVILLNDPILVKREDESSRKSLMITLKERAKSEQIMMFPEATHGNREFLIKFKNGAFNPGSPVQPFFMEFDYNDLLFKNIDHITWPMDGTTATACILMTCCKLWSTAKIIKLPVYYPNEEEQADANLYATNVQKFISEMTNIRMSLYSYDDVRYLSLCRENGIPRSPVCIKLVKMFNRICVKENKRHNQSVITNETTKFDENFRTIEYLLQNIDFVANKMKLQETSPLDDKEKLIDFLEMRTRYPSAIHSSSITDFTEALNAYSSSPATAMDLLLVMYLCDNRLNVWNRIKNYYSAVIGCEKSLTIPQYKNLIWLLLGLEPTVIPDSLFQNTTIDFKYIRINLVPMFERAVNENALILKTDDDLINSEFVELV